MKTNIGDLRGATTAELNKQLDGLYQEQFNLRFQRASGQLANPNRMIQVKRSIARIKTLLHERELANAPAGAQRKATA